MSSTSTTVVVGPVEVLGIGEMEQVLWWQAVPRHDTVVVAIATEAGGARVVAIDPRGASTVLIEDAASAPPAMAPDGTSLVVAAPDPGRGWLLLAVPTTGGEPTLLARSQHRLSVSEVTADATAVLYRELSARPSLSLAQLDGGGSTVLASVSMAAVEPVMGPPTLVGDRVVYATDDEDNGVRLWSARVDKPSRTPLAFAAGLEIVWQITAGGDGRHAVVEADVAGLSSDRALFAVWADGRGPAVLLDEGGEMGVREVSAAGDDVVYRIETEWRSAALSGSRNVRVYDTDRPLAEFQAVDEYAETGSGTFVFTSAAASGDRELYHFDPLTDLVTKLNGDLATHPGVLGRDAIDWVLDFELLGDGHHVAYTTGLAGSATAIPYRLYIAPLP